MRKLSNLTKSGLNSFNVSGLLEEHLSNISNGKLKIEYSVDNFDEMLLQKVTKEAYADSVIGIGVKRASRKVFEAKIRDRLMLTVLSDREQVESINYRLLFDALESYELMNNVNLGLENNEIIDLCYETLTNNYDLDLDFVGLNKISNYIGVMV